jgi:hypothetical protein
MLKINNNVFPVPDVFPCVPEHYTRHGQGVRFQSTPAMCSLFPTIRGTHKKEHIK